MLVAFLAGTVTYLGACVLALAVYSGVFPPITGVQLQRSIKAAVSGSDHSRRYEPVSLSRINRALPLAVVAAEDSRFFLHWGIDWKEVGKAIQEYRNGGRLRGASSITQQVVKNLFLTTHSTVLRKVLEVPLTYAAELLLSKRWILELYPNVRGPGVYGAEVAAQYHYGTSARRLTRDQAAALAACIPNPFDRRPGMMDEYRHLILQRMTVLAPLPFSQTPTAPTPPHARALTLPRPRASGRPYPALSPQP